MQKKVAPTAVRPDTREMRRKAAQERLEQRSGTTLHQSHFEGSRLAALSFEILL
ncbi:hypothetical protein [Nitratifractor sp.]